MSGQRLGLDRIQVAATLRRMREEAGLLREQAAGTLGCTVSKIGDIETGRSGVKPVELERLLDLYRVEGDERQVMVETARAARSRRPRSPYSADLPTGHRRLADLEAQATSVSFYSPELICGILQTPAYARALLGWANWHEPDVVERRVAQRMERGRVLTRNDRRPVSCWFILGETALRSAIGGPAVMREQLDYLLRCADSMNNLMVQVLPHGTGPHMLMGMTITVLRFEPPAPDILFVDTPERDRFSDRESEVSVAARGFELLKAEALGRDESLRMIARVASEYEETTSA